MNCEICGKHLKCCDEIRNNHIGGVFDKPLDFTEKTLADASGFQRVLIGCEGGFSKEEKELLITQEIFRLDTPMVLRSESAVIAVASKILM